MTQANSALKMSRQDSMLEMNKDLAKEGSPCRKCGDGCPGFSMHMWRKICLECHCPREEHAEGRTTDRETAKTGEDASNDYLWMPRNCSLDVARIYFKSLPPDKVPIRGTDGEKYRRKQISCQLPLYDFKIYYSIQNERSEDEKKLFQLFIKDREKNSYGRGEIKLKTDNDPSSLWKCYNCQSTINVDEVAVFAQKAGCDKCWHASCFKCAECNELLVDLIYYYNIQDDKLYCGRHHAEKIGLRCAGCEELIWCEEFATAEGRNWHKDHFCCLKCDKELVGKQYIPGIKDQYPVCLSCHELVPVCETCGEQISDEERFIESNKKRVWHATSECCFCIICKSPLCGKRYLTTDNRLLCSKKHFDLYKSYLKDAPTKMNSFLRKATSKHGFIIIAYNSVCLFFISESIAASKKREFRIQNIDDPELYPAIGSELIRVTPVISVTSEPMINEQFIIIELMKTVQISDLWRAKHQKFIPATCSLNSSKWEHLQGVQCEILSDRILLKLNATHLGLFTVFAQFSHPSSSITLSPNKRNQETTELIIQELPGFKMQFPTISAMHSNNAVEVQVMAHYTDPLANVMGDEATIASPCVSLEPHGLKFSPKIPIFLPIPDWEFISNEYPHAKLQLWHTSGTADSIQGWNIIKSDDIEIKKYNGTTYVAKIYISHFSCNMLRWNKSFDYCGPIARSFLERVHHTKTHCQVLMTKHRKLSGTSEKGSGLELVAKLYQFGKMYYTPVKYSNILYDSGDEPVELNVGTLEIVANLCIRPTLTSSIEQFTQKRSLVLRENSDNQAEFSFKFPYVLELHDSFDLGQLIISQGTNDSKKSIFELKKLLEVEDVYDVLRREHYRWFIIGKALGIRDEIMNSISEDSLGHTDECLKGVIREWIKHRNSSWLTLANALQNEHIPRDLYDIAGHIMDTKVRTKVPTVPQQLHSEAMKTYEDTDKSDYGSVHYNEAEKKAKVPFLYHHILHCDSNGIEFTIEKHDITLRIPKGAVATGKRIRFEIGVAMYGPFTFPESTRPISPIIWLCNLDEDSEPLKLQKPFQLIVPHILTKLTKQNLQEFQIEFGKALHSSLTIDGDQQRYQFYPCDTKPLFASDQYESYGLLKSIHCCFYCLQARRTRDVTKNITYCIVRIERQIQPSPNKSEVSFAGTYFLGTCIQALEEQFPSEEGYKIARYIEFKFESDDPKVQEINLSIQRDEYREKCVIALDPNPAKITAADIDFWEMDFNVMHLKHMKKMYPPRVTMTVTMKPPEQIFSLLVQLSGSSDSERLQMDMTFPLGFPETSSSSLGSAGSDYQMKSGAIHPKDDELNLQSGFTALYQLSAHWDNIGALLGMDTYTIDNIKSDENNNPSRLRRILSQWLKQASPTPTWGDLLKAVSTVDNSNTTIMDNIKSHIAS